MTPSDRLAKRMKQARKELGISQFELGVKAGIDEATAKSRISHYETGLNLPTLTLILKLAAALNKPITWFFCENDELELLSNLYLISKVERKNVIADFEKILKMKRTQTP